MNSITEQDGSSPAPQCSVPAWLCWPSSKILLHPWAYPGLIVCLPAVNTVWQMGLEAVSRNCTLDRKPCTCCGFSTSPDRFCVWALLKAGMDVWTWQELCPSCFGSECILVFVRRRKGQLMFVKNWKRCCWEPWREEPRRKSPTSSLRYWRFQLWKFVQQAQYCNCP